MEINVRARTAEKDAMNEPKKEVVQQMNGPNVSSVMEPVENENIVFVVGDRFEGFANKPGTVVASELSRAIMEGEAEWFGSATRFVPEQGLCEDRMQRLLREARESRLGAAS